MDDKHRIDWEKQPTNHIAGTIVGEIGILQKEFGHLYDYSELMTKFRILYKRLKNNEPTK
jgi:hypothetical protein